MGKVQEMAAAMNQCVKLPRACPRARTRLGKISLMKTQITAPWPKACEAMNTSRLTSTIMLPAAAAAATSAGTSAPDFERFGRRGERIAVGVERPGRAAQAEDVADRADQHQPAAAEMVDDQHARPS